MDRLTAEQRAECRRYAHQVALGQLYCRDARRPEMTGAEMLECYRRWTAEFARLMHLYELADAK